jgi:hypothetical protein
MKAATQSNTGRRAFYENPAQSKQTSDQPALLAKLPPPFLAALLLVLSFSVYLTSPITETSDAMYSMVLSESILHHFSTHLNWFHPPGSVGDGSTPPIGAANNITGTGGLYQIGRIHGNLVYRYPNGSSLLSVPFVALANASGLSAVTPDGRYSKGGEFVIQRLISALLMAILVALVFYTSTVLLDTKVSLLIAVGFAFGTPVWSEATRQLWSHTWLVFLEGLVIYILLSCEERHRPFPAIVVASLLSWMYFARPTGAVSIICVTVFVFIFYRHAFVRFATTGALWFALFLAYNWETFRELIPGYYRARIDFDHAGLSLASNLISPSRGLFVYVPILSLMIYLLARHWKTVPHHRLAVVSLAAISLHLVVLAGYPCWWGGACYGARLMLDVLPWFTLLAILACAEAADRRPWNSVPMEAALAIVLLVLSIGLNARGATSWDCEMWSWEVDSGRHPERMFDWSYPQFAAGILSHPAYAADFEEKLKKAMQRRAEEVSKQDLHFHP